MVPLKCKIEDYGVLVCKSHYHQIPFQEPNIVILGFYLVIIKISTVNCRNIVTNFKTNKNTMVIKDVKK